MFWVLPCSSSGGLRHNCIYAASGIVTLCRWLSCAPVKKESRFFFFVYQHSDLEILCSNGTKTRHGESRCCLRAVAGHEIWQWVRRSETFMERNCSAYEACAGEVWNEGGFTLALFEGWVVGSKVLLEQVQLNFNFRNKFTILLPCGRLVDNNTFLKMCVLKVLLATPVMARKQRRDSPCLVLVPFKHETSKSECR
jgi:hypothetical protein